MPQVEAPRLSHVGLYVTDVPKMTDFYTKVLGFVVSDGAADGRITFLSRNPTDHHQVVLVRGRTTDLETAMVQQVSFNVGTLANVQRAYRKVTEAGCDGIRPTSHGTMFWNSGVSKITLNCEIGWGPRGSSLKAPPSTLNLPTSVSRSLAASGLVSAL